MPILIAIFLILLPFQTNPVKPYLTEIQEVDSYISIFQNEAKIRGISISSMPKYQFRDLPDWMQIAGICNYVTGQIVIDLEYWRQTDNTIHEQLIYHELGHCILYRGHDDSEDKYKISRSIMGQGEFFPKDYFIKHRKDLMDELFQP